MPHGAFKPVATLDLRPDGIRGIPGKIRSLFDCDVTHGGGTEFFALRARSLTATRATPSGRCPWGTRCVDAVKGRRSRQAPCGCRWRPGEQKYGSRGERFIRLDALELEPR